MGGAWGLLRGGGEMESTVRTAGLHVGLCGALRCSVISATVDVSTWWKRRSLPSVHAFIFPKSFRVEGVTSVALPAGSCL